MQVPDSGIFEIVEVKATSGKSVKVSLQRVDSFDDPIGPVYANQQYCVSPLVAGTKGKATFEHKTSKDPKPNDKGYLSLSVWCPVDGVPPPGNPTGGTAYTPPATKQERPYYAMDGRDRLIVRQTSLKAAAEVIAASGGDANDIKTLAEDLYNWVLDGVH